MSAETSQHSRDIAAHPAVGLVVFDSVVFDSTVPAYFGRCVYASGVADALTGDELRSAFDVYPGSEERGGSAITEDEVTGASAWRLYRVQASELWVLCPRDPRQPCERHGRADDHRVRLRG